MCIPYQLAAALLRAESTTPLTMPPKGVLQNSQVLALAFRGKNPFPQIRQFLVRRNSVNLSAAKSTGVRMENVTLNIGIPFVRKKLILRLLGLK
jgi:hypothetical protein